MRWLILVLFLIACYSCESGKPQSDPLFKAVPDHQSSLDFSNTLMENDSFNYFTFPYLYMGGGVAIGDINNDELPDVFLTGNQVPNKLWLNKGDMQFEDISIDAGVQGDNRWYTGTLMHDFNADGWLDIYVCVSGKYGTTRNQLFINNHDNTFTEAAAEFGLDDSMASIQAVPLDYDGDGDLDLFVGNYPLVPVSQGNDFYYLKMQENQLAESGHLYRNNGDKTFTDVTTHAGVQNFGLTLGVVASDLNQDGWTDLYVSNDFNVPDYLYLNNGDGTFRESIQEATNNTSMFGMGIDAGDFNNDGWIDLIQADMTPEDYKRAKTNMASMNPEGFWEAVELGFHYQYMQNSLQLNNGAYEGNPIFSNVARLGGVATTDWSWAPLFLDMDNDGWKDIFITNGMKRDVNNQDANRKLNSNAFFASNNNDFTILPSEPLSNYTFQNKGNLDFQNVTADWGIHYKGFSNGVAYADLDLDGDLDLVINNLDAPLSLFENRTDAREKNFLQLSLKGPSYNPFGIGAKVTIQYANQQQVLEQNLVRGFQSSVEPTLHFGLGDNSTVDRLEIRWPDGKKELIENIPSNQRLVLSHTNAKVIATKPQDQTRFKDITKEVGLNFVHKEDRYNDFDDEPLLPHKYSQIGPGLAVGDINGDGLDDFFIGNARQSTSQMYIQQPDGRFSVLAGPWENDEAFEVTGALLIDLDHDKDLDLYVVHGGNSTRWSDSSYQDRLYLNTDEGFVRANLPTMINSGKVVSPGDYDQDGDLDLFVGGRILPGQYPLAAPSYLLENNGEQNEALEFTNVTAERAPFLQEGGLVTDALWDDFNGDDQLDLILTGEWLPIQFYQNSGSEFENVTAELGLEGTEGWWYSLAKTDLDGDGDQDYLAGNLGLNYKYHASKDIPFEIYANDFDENSRLDIVLSYAKGGTKLPLRGLECSSQQVPAIKRRFPTFEAFAKASLKDIYSQPMLDKSLHYEAKTFAHHWIERQENGQFMMHELPQATQLSSINDFELINYNGDAYPDWLIAGNLYTSEVETPRNDASVGLVMITHPDGEMEVVMPQQSGLYLRGEVKEMAKIKLGENQIGILVAFNDGPLKLFEIGISPEM